jgi:hypothetical protein
MSESSKRVDARQAAAYLGVSYSLVCKWRMEDRIHEGPPFSDLGGRIVYDIADLDAFLRKNKRGSQ